MTTINSVAQGSYTGQRMRFLRRFARNRLALSGAIILVFLVGLCVVGPWLSPFDNLAIDIYHRFIPPFESSNIFGTDALGRDLATRVFSAGRISLAVGFAAMVVSVLIGATVGLIAGYLRGWIGAVLMRIVDAFLSFPSVFLVLVLSAFTKPGPISITLIIAATSWMEIARIVDAETRSLREQDFVLAAKLNGSSRTAIIVRDLIPNTIGPIVVAATLTVAKAILLEAYISYLGYGIQPPLPSWGNMINSAQQYLGSAPWLAIVPGIAIVLAVTSFNFVGDGLRDALDARSHES